MIEIELKFEIKRKDIKRLFSLLQKMDYLVVAKRAYEKTVMYDNHGGLMQITDGRVRLCLGGEECKLSYKKPISRDSIKKEIEYEIEVSDFETTEKILEELGFLPVSSYERYRTLFKSAAGDTKVTIDEYPFASFLEIEGKEEEIKKLASALNLSLGSSLSDPCDTLFQKWRAKRGLSFKPHMMFKDYDK